MSPEYRIRKKPNHLSIQQQINVQQELKKDKLTITEIAIIYRISKRTVLNIKNRKIIAKEKIKRKKIHHLKHGELDKQLFKWHLEWKTSGKTTTYELLYKEAKKIIKDVGGPYSRHLRDWLQRFMKRHEILEN